MNTICKNKRIIMETNSKNDKFKTKRPNCNKKDMDQYRKLLLQWRGLYVESFPIECGIDEDIFKASSSKSSQRSTPSTIETSSIFGNHKSFTPGVVKTERRLKKSKMLNKGVTNLIELSTLDQTKGKRRNRQKKAIENMTEDIVYVMQSRTNMRADMTPESYISRSLNSNLSNISFERDVGNADSIASESYESHLDKIAAEVLQGWITRKEKNAKLTKNLDNSNIVEKTDRDNYNLPKDLALTGCCKEYGLGNLLSCSNEKPSRNALDSVAKKLTFDISEDSNISKLHYNTPRKFSTIETSPSVKRKCRVARKTSKATKHEHCNDNYKDSKRNTKKEFMDLIKRELKKSKCALDKPRSMFEALKSSVRNKQLSKRHFSKTNCEFLTPKLLRSSKMANRLKSLSTDSPIHDAKKSILRRKRNRH